MIPTEPLPLHHSWPLAHIAQRFDLGRVHDAPSPPAGDAPGSWACDLSTNVLRWSPLVYRLFGLPEGGEIARAASLALYDEPSRAAMERLRAHAIKHRRGFTLDIRILPVDRAARWLRLMAAPECEGQQVVRLRGYKTDVTDLYSRA